MLNFSRVLRRCLYITVLLVANIAKTQSPLPQCLFDVQLHPWQGSGIPTYLALSKITGELARIPNPPVIVMEGWNQEFITGIVYDPNSPRHGAAATTINPDAPTFDVNTNGMSLGEFMELTAKGSGGMEWRRDARNNVCALVEPALFNNPRWPLNWPMGKHAGETLTYTQADTLIGTELYPRDQPVKHALAASSATRAKIGNKIVWRGGAKPGTAYRELVYSMQRTMIESDSDERCWGMARVTPELEPPNFKKALSLRQTITPGFEFQKAQDDAKISFLLKNRKESLTDNKGKIRYRGDF